MEKFIFILICLLAGYGLGTASFQIGNYAIQSLSKDKKTTYSFDLYIRPDGSGYMKYGPHDWAACQLLVSNSSP